MCKARKKLSILSTLHFPNAASNERCVECRYSQKTVSGTLRTNAPRLYSQRSLSRVTWCWRAPQLRARGCAAHLTSSVFQPSCALLLLHPKSQAPLAGWSAVAIFMHITPYRMENPRLKSEYGCIQKLLVSGILEYILVGILTFFHSATGRAGFLVFRFQPCCWAC